MSTSTKNGETITLEYDLYDLPTAQHKAGLAGLLLMIESMKMRQMVPIPEVKYDSTNASISFTPESMQTLFDDLYGAAWVEVERTSKRKNRNKQVIEPKQDIVREVVGSDGKTHKKTIYIYDDFQPRGGFLQTLYPADSDGWLKLWRDMVWQILRVKPTTRGVYKERADNRPSSESKDTLNQLRKSIVRRGNGDILIGRVVSSTFIGAQDKNAEGVPFQGTVEHNLLLHFWTIAALIYVPRLIKRDNKSKEKDYHLEEAGYVLAIPEPSNLEVFVKDAQRLFKSLDTKKSGFRPRAALITVPGEGGLEYLYYLAHSRIVQQGIAYSLAAIEIYYMERQGDNARTLAADRILPDEQILADYENLRRQCHNPLHRSQRIKNLLSGEPWYTGMDTAFSQYPWEFFVASEGKTPRKFPFFGDDTRNKFNAIESELSKGGDFMSNQLQDDKLALCVYRLTREYVNRRTEEKSGEKYDKFKNQKDDKGRIIYPDKYRKEVGDVCSDAFLAMRSRREKDFVEYFTGTICSVPQYLPEDDYLTVSTGLITEPDKVKTLAMLALSASSSVGRPTEEKEGGD